MNDNDTVTGSEINTVTDPEAALEALRVELDRVDRALLDASATGWHCARASPNSNNDTTLRCCNPAVCNSCSAAPATTPTTTDCPPSSCANSTTC